MQLRIFGIDDESIVDGPGIRFAIFTQGCPHACKGCHNPESHSYNGGTLIDTEDIFLQIKQDPMLKGVTFSGGEPFSQPQALSELAQELHEHGGCGGKKLDLTVYTGYTFEQLLQMNNKYVDKLLSFTDILIDGKYDDDKRDIALLFRGSSNQRILDGKKSYKNKVACPITL